MENYVCELSRALLGLGQKVTIICESREQEVLPQGLELIVVGNRYHKPRWLAQWGFSQKVSQFIGQNTYSDTIIHSHERSSVHHVSTFHGPPFLMRKNRLLDVLSPRIAMWTKLEKKELMGTQVLAILPNSPLIGGQLKSLYPAAAAKVLEPAYPGVIDSFSKITRHTDGVTVGFLGREWKRKGLDVACQILQKLRETVPEAHFLVAGCDAQEIAHLFNGWSKDSYTLLGWIAEPSDFLGKVDLLLHPARSEPFGMAIAEANAVGIPVVVSNHCGIAALVGPEQGFVCPLELDAPSVELWVDACLSILNSKPIVTSMNLSWDTLAQQHIRLYRELLPL
jgi:UDP-glucose:(heptosyl)LPS alpha-1,3-glucosyltransferase